MTTRRQFLRATSNAAIGARFAPAGGLSSLVSLRAAAQRLTATTPEEAARDEDFWFAVQQAYSLDSRYIILNAGASNPSPRVVQDALIRLTEYVNGSPLVNMYRTGLYPQRETVRRRLARHVNCSPDEIALTRNTTEGLNIAVMGLTLRAGDEVLTTDWEHGSLVNPLSQRERRDGVRVVKVPLRWSPPQSQDEIVEAFRRAITPRTRALFVSHVIDGIGQIMPVSRICALARERNITSLVDGALSFAHVPLDVREMNCDFFATSLHKWLSAPLGTGFLYVRREIIPSVYPLFGAAADEASDIRKFESIGTHAVPPFVCVGQALDFYESIGTERKAARLHYLKTYWTDKLRDEPKIKLHTPLDRENSCATVHVEIEGADARRLSQYMSERESIYVYPIVRRPPDVAETLSGVYVSPNVFTRLPELDAFVDAMRRIARNGLPAA